MVALAKLTGAGMSMNMPSQAPPLLPNSSYSNMKNMHGSNLTSSENYVPMQNPNMIHSYNPGNIPANAVPNAQTHHAHDMMGGRPMMPNHGMSGNQGHIPPMGHSMGQEPHNPIQQPIASQYMMNQPRPMASHQQIPMNMSAGHQTTQPSNMQYMQGNNYGMQGNQVPNQPVAANAAAAGQQNSSIIGRPQVPKPWHTVEHAADRESMTEEIVRLLKSRRPNATDNWHEKLPQMAKRLEEALYFDATSLVDYADKTTLKQRLQQLAISMGGSKNSSQPRPPQGNVPPANQNAANVPRPMGTGVAPQGQGAPGQAMNSNYNANQSQMFPQHMPQQMPQQIPQMHPNMSHQQPMNNSYNQQYPQQNMAGRQGQPNPQYPQMNQPNAMNMNPQQNQMRGMQQQQQQQPMHHNAPMEYNNNQMRNMPMQGQPMMQQNPPYNMPMDPNANNGYMNNYPQQNPNMQPHGMLVGGQQMQHPHMNQQQGNYPQAGTDDANMHAMNQNMMGANRNNVPRFQAPMGNQMLDNAQLNAGGAMVPGGTAAQTQDEHRKQVLKQQQQRLLLLRHASKCPHESGRCPVTPHCWNMKQLWKHIMSCKDQECKIPHCVSSRYVLSHYSKCKEATCPVCGPVREAIKRNYLKSQEIVNGVRGNMTNNVNPPDSLSQTIPAIPAPVPTIAPPVASETKGNKGKRPREDASANATIVIPPKAAPKKSIYPLDPISCAVYTFSPEQIQAHFKTVQEGLRLTVARIKEMCKPILEELFKVPLVFQVFGSPVDPSALGIPEYNDIIKFPMDLGTVMKRLESGSYRDLQNFVHDVHLTFDNAMQFNPERSDVHVLAKSLKKDFDTKFKKKVLEFEKDIEERRKSEQSCLICGEVSLKFEPPVFYCNGPCCQKIRRNSTYYCYNNAYHWCTGCYNQIKDKDNGEIRLPDAVVKLSELQKKKHNEDSEEGWVQCDGGCKRWIHQVCALFNNRRNVSDEVSYVCPICLQEKRKKNPELEIVATTTKKMRAVDLPKTTLTEFLEKRICKRLQMAYEEYAENMGVSINDVEKCPELVLRQVSCLDKLQPVREGVFNRYKDKNYPPDFPCRTKCLILFQNIDGQDVILFGMYVYEYGHKCPQPNQRRVYVSYLDSVHYLRPKQYRTMVYHEILISYLDYVKARGFHTAHIWACPPQKGDDYILYVHPADQKTPKPQILRIWYDDMLKKCVERGIVVELTDLHAEFLANTNNEATVLPYFEGDYWVNEAEVIIKNLKDGGKGGDDTAGDDAAGNKSKRRNKTKRAPQSVVYTTTGVKIERDPVMAKLAAIIEPMKDTFFVARLHPKEYADKFAEVDNSTEKVANENKEQSEKDLQEEALSGQDIVPQIPKTEGDEAVKQTEQPPTDDGDDDFSKAVAQMNKEPDAELGGEAKAFSYELEEPAVAVVADEAANATTTTDSVATDVAPPSNDVAESKDESGDAMDVDEAPPTTATTDASSSAPIEVKGEIKAEETGAAGEDQPKKRMIKCGEDMPNLPDDTEDVDDVQECEHFDTRQSFLNLCQGNHYQYDQLRRAKHSSMMVLYHLHNPDAPKFVPSCGKCSTDILSGSRFRCEKCEMDFCQSCYTKEGTSIHNHPLRAVNSSAAPAPLTEEQRRERQRSIQLHMQLLSHAAGCKSCPSNNCAKMKVSLYYF